MGRLLSSPACPPYSTLVSAVIPAAGLGLRFGMETPKQFYELEGVTVLERSIKALASYPFAEFVVGINPDERHRLEEMSAKFPVPIVFSSGGATRMDTVLNALKAAKGEFAAVHDAARPFVSAEVVKNTVDTALREGACICGLFAVDTVKLVEGGRIASTLERSKVFLAHTPQVFHREKLIMAMEQAKEEGVTLTDEASAYERLGFAVSICRSNKGNIKITTKDDIL